jgi:hypothetical protein
LSNGEPMRANPSPLTVMYVTVGLLCLRYFSNPDLAG